jgi:hypothetical protein
MLKPLRKVLLTTLGILPMLMPLDDVRASDAVDSKDDYITYASELPWRKARLSLEAQTGTRTIGTLDTMIPFMGNDDFIIYADLMAKAATDNAFEGNLGLGFRRVNDSETAIFGMYAFYDVLKSVNNNQFTQVTVGAERLGLTWDFRANVYLPIGKTKYTHNIYDQGSARIVDHNVIQYIKTQAEEATYGGDLEIGRTLGTNKVRGYVAAYTFGENLTGPRARVEYQINSHVALNAAVQYDQTRKTQYLLGARFTVGGAKTTNSDSIYSRLTDPVVRDVDVVTKAKISDTTRTAVDKFWMVDQSKTISGGNGTIENPYSSIDDAIAAAPEGAIIYVKAVDGKVYQANGTQLKQGQVLVGSYQDLHFDFERNIAHFTATDNSLFLMAGNGIRPTISGMLTANSHVGIYNLDILANELARGQAGITVYNAQDVIIENVSTSGFNAENGRGIDVQGDSQVTISNLAVRDNYIGLNVENGVVNITGALTADQSQLAGVRMAQGRVTADSMQISSSGEYGVLALGGTLAIKNNLAIDGGVTGLLAQTGAQITANNLTIRNSNLQVDAAQVKITHELNVDVEQIQIKNGGVVNSETANVTTDKMTVNQGFWSNNNGFININGLALENYGNVKFSNVTINQLQVESASVLTSNTLLLNGDVTVSGAATQLNVLDLLTITAAKRISVTDQGNITANVADVTSETLLLDNATLIINSGSINLSGDFTLKNAATANVKSVNLNANNISVANSAFTATNIIANGNIDLINGKLTATNNFIINNKNLTIDAQSYLQANKLTILTEQLNVIGGAIFANQADITTPTLQVNEGGRITKADGSKIAGQLTLTGKDANSLMVTTGGQIKVTNATFNDANILVTNAESLLNADVITVTNKENSTTDQIEISDNARVVAVQESNITTNKVILNKGFFEIAKGTLTARNSNMDGIVVTAGELHAKEIRVEHNGNDGMVVNSGLIEVETLNVLENKGNGIKQIDGTLIVEKADLKQNGQNGFSKMGGDVVINSGEVSGNGANGFNIASAMGGFAANNVTIKDNIGNGVLLGEGTVILDTVNITNNYDNQIKVSGPKGARNLTIKGKDKTSNTISAGTTTAGLIDDKASAAILVESDAIVDMSNITVNDSQKAYALRVDAGNVTLNNVDIKNNQRGIILGQGSLTLNHATVTDNAEYGILAKGNAQQKRILNLSDVTLTNTGTSEATVVGIGYGLVILDATTANIENSRISGNKTGGVYVLDGDLKLNSLKIYNNNNAGIKLEGDKNIKLVINNSEIYKISGEQLVGIDLAAKNATISLTTTVLHDNTDVGLNWVAAASFTCNDVCDIYNSKDGVKLFANAAELNNFNLHNNNNGLNLADTVQNITVGNSVINNNQIGINADDSEKISLLLNNTHIINHDKNGILGDQQNGIKIAAKKSVAIDFINGSEISENKSAAISINGTSTIDTLQVNIQNAAIHDNKAMGIDITAANAEVTAQHNKIINNGAVAINLDIGNAKNVNLIENSIIGNLIGIKTNFTTAGIATLNKNDVRNNAAGIEIGGNNTIINLKNSNLIVSEESQSNNAGIRIKNAVDARIVSEGTAAIVGGKNGVEILDSSGLISLNGVLFGGIIAENNIYASITKDIRIELLSVKMNAVTQNGIMLEAPTKATFDLKINTSQISNTTKNNIYIKEKVAQNFANSKLYMYKSTLSAKEGNGINNHSYAALYVQASSIIGGGADKGTAGIISSGSADSDFVSGGAIYLDQAYIDHHTFFVTSSNYLDVSDLSITNVGIYRLAGMMVCRDAMNCDAHGVWVNKNRVGNVQMTAHFNWDQDAGGKSINGNPLGW